MLLLKNMFVCRVCIMHAYNIDDPYHTGRIDLPGIVKMVSIVCTCLHVIISN